MDSADTECSCSYHDFRGDLDSNCVELTSSFFYSACDGSPPSVPGGAAWLLECVITRLGARIVCPSIACSWSESAMDVLPTPPTRSQSSLAVTAYAPLFFFRFDFDAEAPAGVGCEAHGEPGRLVRGPKGVGKPAGPSRRTHPCVAWECGCRCSLGRVYCQPMSFLHLVSVLQSSPLLFVPCSPCAVNLRVTRRGPLSSRCTWMSMRVCASA